jgi:hypothetical protein
LRRGTADLGIPKKMRLIREITRVEELTCEGKGKSTSTNLSNKVFHFFSNGRWGTWGGREREREDESRRLIFSDPLGSKLKSPKMAIENLSGRSTQQMRELSSFLIREEVVSEHKPKLWTKKQSNCLFVPSVLRTEICTARPGINSLKATTSARGGAKYVFEIKTLIPPRLGKMLPLDESLTCEVNKACVRRHRAKEMRRDIGHPWHSSTPMIANSLHSFQISVTLRFLTCLQWWWRALAFQEQMLVSTPRELIGREAHIGMLGTPRDVLIFQELTLDDIKIHAMERGFLNIP